MAVATDATIDSVRRRIRDYPGRDGDDDYLTSPVYEDAYYLDAVAFALSKLSLDFGTVYATDADVPASRYFLLVKLATIEMCWIRAGDAAESDVGDVREIQVPDLTIKESWDTVGSDYWLKLASALQDEYDGELDRAASAGVTETSQVQQIVATRTSRATGQKVAYQADAGIDAPADVSATAIAGGVRIAWGRVPDIHFAQYEVYRDVTSAGLDRPVISQRVQIIPDINGVNRDGILGLYWEDVGLAAGDYFYRVAAMNDNGLRGFSGTVTAEVV